MRPQSMVAAERPLVVFIMGPTAVGKTDLAIALSEKLPIDIISVDSAMVYRGMDVGTAKPSAEELAKAPHQLIDICDPSHAYSVAEFMSDAKLAITESIRNDRIPVLVGGTHMYFHSLYQGMAAMPATDPGIRLVLMQEAKELGWPHMHRLLAEVDPEYASTLHPNHSQRIGRALEVYRQSGKTMTQWRQEQAQASWLAERCQVAQVALWPDDRANLHQRIAQRFALMMEQGFAEEVQALFDRGDLHIDLPAIRSVGYRQMWQCLAGECTQDEAVERAIVATRQLAKRQLTWLRKWPDVKMLVRELSEKSSKNLENEDKVKKISKITTETLNYLPLKSI